jgi:succinoglycan biosynthesis transport protein ExoP
VIEEEFDLRGYLKVLIRGWKWILGAGVIAGGTALIVSFLMAPTYEATALVVVTEDRYQMQLDTRFETVEGLLAEYEVFPTLATSDDVLLEVLDRYSPSDVEAEDWTLHALSELVEAESRGDPSLVVLTAQSHSAEDAAGMANVWAEVLAERANDIYGEGEDDVAFFEERVADAQVALDEAEAGLAEFEGRNQSRVLQAELDSYARTQADYLADQRGIAYILQDIDGLHDQLAALPVGSAATLADDLTALFLQIKAFNAGASAPIQLQVESAASLSSRSLSEQIAFLGGLAATLEAKSAQIDERLAELVSPTLELQEALQRINSERDGLARARDLASEQYVVLARRSEEARLAASEEERGVRVGSYAALPEEPVSPRKLLNTMLAGVVGLMMGVGTVTVAEWWNGGEGYGREDRESGIQAGPRALGETER